MPRCLATESRNDEGEGSPADEPAIAAPPAPSTARATDATASFFFDFRTLMA
jgi:hypothetical protein